MLFRVKAVQFLQKSLEEVSFVRTDNILHHSGSPNLFFSHFLKNVHTLIYQKHETVCNVKGMKTVKKKTTRKNGGTKVVFVLNGFCKVL